MLDNWLSIGVVVDRMLFNLAFFRARTVRNPQLERLVPLSVNPSALLWCFLMVNYHKCFSTASLLAKQIQNTYA